MDLFDDLPEPGKQGEIQTVEISQSKSWGDNNSDIFSDLPLPISNSEIRGTKRKLEDAQTNDCPTDEKTDPLYALKGYFAEKKGEREEMQDCHVLIEDFHKQISELHPSISRLSYFAVFDGHGGTRASKFAASHLHQNLAEKFPKGPQEQIEKELKRTLMEVFRKTDEDFLKEATRKKPSWKDGTTAIVVMALQNILYISNLGDSKAILCRYNSDLGKHISIPLSIDHSPTDYAERMRIQKAGGHVKDGRVMGIIEVSRSIGDGQYKSLGVISVPDVKRCQFTDADKFVLLACDGLWKVFSSQEVIDIVTSCKKGNESNHLDICYETACNKLVNEAIRRYSGDNVTVVIISISKNI